MTTVNPARGRRVLLAWEMGEGLGHAARLLMLAQRLQALGWTAVVAARDPAALAARYAAAQIPVIATPAHRSCFAGPGRFRAASFADVMGVCAYAEKDQLAAMVAAWDRVLSEQRPDVVIADYAPLLSLAAFGRVPVIAVGDGFVTPHGMPDGSFPPLGEQAPPVWQPAQLLAAAHQVQAARGLPLPDSLPHIIHGAGQVVAVPPELDIYGATRPAPAAGPWYAPPPLAPPPALHVFCYLRMQHPPARALVQALMALQVPGECHLHGAGEHDAKALALAGIHVHPQPPPLRDALARASILIHHGGIGSIEEAALAGRPQLLLPRHLEQQLNTRRAMAALPGVFALRAGGDPGQLRQQLAALLNDARLMPAAQHSAARLAARPATAWQALLQLLATIV